ncbi:sn-glycerol-3-phosphate import ATP-binding protein UgpC [Aureimonas flava]|uniref:sn-glycerol-3-phosphate import ATP-binding protein UgpC n=1 Tax=Aureimonas flava TaxID=2320271 RepID=A0A3A1WPC2_9HYPH|nr:sn-glycerol-3-phosphate import ATP-binding protein UgpC [Aureimonas flava]RIY01976.1 sn-glycerol-3-phosphate import ATP-binding protein UgpC [Aureimonas flava]
MASITLSDVRKTYPNGQEAVKGISLDIADGEFVVLVGPSGCGKSTLLRMVAGLEPITGGEVRIGDRRVNDLEPADRDIAMVFQNYALYPHMSVRQNLAYGLKNRKMPAQEIERRIGEAARALEIETYLDRKPGQLSGGQRQRVAMGRAIVREPAAFLFDEPLSNLDAKLRVSMRAEIRRLQKRLSTTSLYVTHDQLEAMTLADRLVVLNGGRVEQVGTPIEVYERPASLFVAGFIGSPAMNLVPLADAMAIDGMDRALVAAPGASHVLGIRPEHVSILEGPGDGRPATEVTLNAIERVGAETYLYGALPSGGADIALRTPGHVRKDLGERVRIGFDPAALHLFSAETGRRVDG